LRIKIYPTILLLVMRFGIVVSDAEDWTARALHASFTRQGADALFLNFSELAALIDQDLSISSNGIDLLDLDGLIVRDLGRRGAQDVAFRFETLQALVESGFAIVNPPHAIARAANKFATSLALKRAGVPTPKTMVTTSPKEAARALDRFGKAVSKPLFGYKGKGIILLQKDSEEDRAQLEEIIESHGLVYLQEFVASSAPRDIRAFVVGGRVLGAIYRVAPPGQWISNLARGGKAEPCPVTPELEDLALQANQAVGAVYSGVDLLETPDGLKVIEVNGTPSGKGIYEALGVDVTASIAARALEIGASK
jgi:tetrahydromethanopterin:alpha-L-glutamate ligase